LLRTACDCFLEPLLSILISVGLHWLSLALFSVFVSPNPFVGYQKQNFPIALIAYYSPTMTIIAIVVSLLVSVSNAAKIVAAQALGEEEFYRFTANILLKNSPALVLLFLLLPALFYIILGFTLLLFYNDPGFDWASILPSAFLTYASAIDFHSTVFYFRLRRSHKNATLLRPVRLFAFCCRWIF
jgi:Na+-driven multidrug efflux pump